jgi:mono/diheme cytochrome c family protein
VYYPRDIQPILTANCAYSGCHDAQTAADGIVLTSYQTVMATAGVEPFDLDDSDLYQAITDTDDDFMPPPPASPLLPAQVQLIAKWINQGALNKDCIDCSTANVTYTGTIAPLINANCLGCHNATSANGGIVLETYGEVVGAVNNNGLLSAVKRENGYTAMPPGGAINSCDLLQLETWISNGMPQ